MAPARRAVFATEPRAVAALTEALTTEAHDLSSARWAAADGDGLAHDGTLDELLSTVDEVVIALEPPLPLTDRDAAADDSDAWLDVHTMRIYTLALAVARRTEASSAPVRVVLVSSMAVFASADDTLGIQTNWRRRPSTAPESLAPHLAELVLEEFLKESSIRLSIVRLGTIGDVAPTGARWWTPRAEALEAVTAALQTDAPAPSEAASVTHCFHYAPDGTYPLPALLDPHPPLMVAEEEDLPLRRAVLFGARGMMGPSAATALGAAGLEKLLITDVGTDSTNRDSDQTKRSLGDAVEHDRGGMKRGAEPQVRKRLFCAIVLPTIIILPRQARNKHRESTQTSRRFLIATAEHAG